MSIPRDAPRERGFTLLELIMFIVIVGAAVAGVLGAISYASRVSVDPMIQKQALAIAEAVLEEVQLMPFTYCDPDDANAATATSSAGCTAGGSEAIGAEAAAPWGPETRTGGTTPFDNVNDYNGFSMTGMTDIGGNPVTGLNQYTVAVSVATQGVPSFGGAPAIPGNEALLISVTVSNPQMSPNLVLQGYRVRYAPNALP